MLLVIMLSITKLLSRVLEKVHLTYFVSYIVSMYCYRVTYFVHMALETYYH